MQKLGVGYGFDLNGFTQPDNTVYQVNLTGGSSADIKTALKNFSQLVKAPDLTDYNLQQEKKIVLAELKLRDTVKNHASQDARKFQYPNRHRETVLGIGTEKSLQAITLNDVNVFFKTHYRPEKVLLVVAGGVSEKETKETISQLFSEWSVEPAPRIKRPKHLPIDIKSFPSLGAFKKQNAKTQLNAIENAPPSLKNDIKSYRKKAFIEKMALSMMRTRLKPRIENDYKVSWIRFSKRREKEYDIRSVILAAKDYPRAMTVFEEERLRAIEYGFMAEEIEYALKKWSSNLERLAEKPALINAVAEASRLRQTYNSGQVYNSHSQKLETFKALSKTISADNYHQAARDMWEDFEPRYWTQSATSMSETVRKVKAIREKISQSEITPPKSLNLEEFQNVDVLEKGTVLARDIFSDQEIHRLLFKNGSRLNYRRTKTEPNKIAISVALNGNLTSFVSQYSSLAERVNALSRADIKGKTKSEMDRTFVGQQASFHASLAENSIILSSSTRPQDLKAALNVISKFISDMDIQSQNYKDQFKNKISRIKTSSKNSPLMAGALKIPSAYSGAPPAFRSESSGLYPAPIYTNTNKSIGKIINSGTIEVGIVGDFDPKVLEDIFANSIGSLPPRKAPLQSPPAEHKDITHIDPGVTSLTYSGTNKQMALFYCWPEDKTDNFKEQAISSLITQIVHNRLMEKFREELGVTYSPQVIQQKNTVFPEFLYNCHAIQIAPKDEEKVHDNFRYFLNQLATHPISKTELTRAREPITSILKRYVTTNEISARMTAMAYSQPGKIDEHRSIISILNKIRLKTLNQHLSKRYEKSNLHIFRIQHYQNNAALKEKTLRVKSQLGDPAAQYELGKISLKTDTESALLWFEKAAAQQNKNAHFELGKYYASLGNDKKKAAKHLKLSSGPKEGAFLLADLYFRNPNLFPDISETRIMELYKLSAENGFVYGQKALAQRYKDGSITKRNEMKALKWALISRGKSKAKDSEYIRKFKNNVSNAEQKEAQQTAEAWLKRHSYKSQE